MSWTTNEPVDEVYVVMHYRESNETPAPMAGGYNIARTVYVTHTLDGAVEHARLFKIQRNEKITSVDHNPVEPREIFYDHLGVRIGEGWQLDVRERPEGEPSIEMMADAYEHVRWMRTLKIVGRELIWVEKQRMSRVW